MGLLAKIAAGFRNMAGASVQTSADLAKELQGNGFNLSGVPITPKDALSVIVVGTAVALLSETIAGLPLPIYKRLDGGGKERNDAHPAWALLNVAPNGYQNAFEWREMMTAHLLLWGNCYSAKTMVGTELRELLPLYPERVKPVQDPKTLKVTYKVYTPDGGQITLPAEKMFHIRDKTLKGVEGLSRILLSKDGLGSAKAAERFGAAFFGNSGQPAGILSTESKLNEAQMKDLRESWKETQGGDNVFGIAVLDGGWKFTPITALMKDAQFIEFRKFCIAEVARIFRIPPHMLGDLDKATFSNIEQQSLEFVKYALLPWLRRWEMAINTQLIAPQRTSPNFAEFNVDGLLRGDQKGRAEFYSTGLRDGWLNRNEVREMENRNPIPGGDEYKVAQSIFGGGKAPPKQGNDDVQEQPAEEPAQAD